MDINVIVDRVIDIENRVIEVASSIIFLIKR